MDFRVEFEKLCGSKGFTDLEKDPEEFFTLLLLKVNHEPLIHLRLVKFITYSMK